jgi:hypothetical protein
MWKLLDQGTQELWNQFAATHGVRGRRQGVGGNAGTVFLSGQAFFVSYMANWYTSCLAPGGNGIAAPVAPPTGPWQGRVLSQVALTHDTVTGPPAVTSLNLRASFPDLSTALSTEEMVFLYATAPVSVGARGSVLKGLRLIACLDPETDMAVVDISAIYAARFGAVPALGQCVGVGVRVYTFSDGATPEGACGYVSDMVYNSLFLGAYVAP